MSKKTALLIPAIREDLSAIDIAMALAFLIDLRDMPLMTPEALVKLFTYEYEDQNGSPTLITPNGWTDLNPLTEKE